MKIAVAGKGGSGKTTIAGTLARTLSRRGEMVLAIDGDTNPNLGISAGISRDRLQDIAVLPGSLLGRITDTQGKTRAVLTLTLDEIKRQYGFRIDPHLMLLGMGRVDHAGTGWKCHAHATVRELTATIAEGSREHVVLDMEAGVEHLSRGTTRNTDTLLVIAEPYYKSLETAARVVSLGRELGIPRVLAVANKVRPADQDSIDQFLTRHGIELFATIPQDDSVLEADRLGVAPIDHDASSALVRQVDELAGRLM